MEPVGSIVRAMSKVVLAIVKAAKTARRNKARCRELAQRANEVHNVLREYRKVARGGASSAATTRRILRRLKGAIDDALKLAESCGRSSDGGLLSRLELHRLVASDGLAAKLDDVNCRITTCLVDLQAANVVGMMGLHAANGTGMEKKMDKLAVAAGARDHRRRTNNRREDGGKRRRGNKAADPPPKPRPGAVAGGAPFCHVHHHHFMIEDEGPMSFSVM